jgi:hypothetical protein
MTGLKTRAARTMKPSFARNSCQRLSNAGRGLIGQEFSFIAIDRASCNGTNVYIPLPDANAHGENRLPAVGRAFSSHPTRLRRGSGLVHEAALPVMQERRRLAFAQGQTKRRSSMNRHESRALPDSLGVIVREYLKSFPDRETFADGPESRLLSARAPGRGEDFLGDALPVSRTIGHGQSCKRRP